MAQIGAKPLVGIWRRFGASGPAYEIIALGPSTADGTDRMIRIRLAETGEEADYTLNRALDDELLVGA